MANTLLEKLVRIYGSECMLGGKGRLSVHHLVPKRVRVDNRIENLALLSKKMHELFNKIEAQDQENGDYINEYLIKVKRMKRR
jgi:hypothetical protein